MNLNTFSIFFDGTGNGPQDKYPSNVFKLYKLFDKLENKEKLLPRALYCPGPGAKEYDVMVGELLGSGIWGNIKDAYRELTKIFNLSDNIDIAIFGFSRGAYTAHLFVWLLQYCGIPKDLSDCDNIVDLFKVNPENPFEHHSIATTPVESIVFLGVWDIVKSVVPNREYHDGKLPNIVRKAYHAMSLDELRKDFPVTKWALNSAVQLQQTWFSGVHSDIGGGYQTCGLSDITLKWMYEHVIEEALPCSIVKDDYFNVSYVQDLNDPFKEEPMWVLRGKNARDFMPSETVDLSVHLRHEMRKDYTPKAKGWSWPCR